MTRSAQSRKSKGGRDVKIRSRKRSIEPTPLTEDVHIHIGGSLVIRFLPPGDIQVPIEADRRHTLSGYLRRLLIELESYQ